MTTVRKSASSHRDTEHPWLFPVEDAEGHRTQLGMGVTREGRLSFAPPQGKPFTIHPDQLLDLYQAVNAHAILIGDALSRAATARAVAGQ